MTNTATLTPATVENIVGDKGEPLVRTTYDAPSGLVITFEYRWFTSVPEATADLTSGDIVLPAVGDPARDMVTALAATLIRSLRAPGVTEELLEEGYVLIERPDWETGHAGLKAWATVARQFERKGWNIGTLPNHYALYRR